MKAVLAIALLAGLFAGLAATQTRADGDAASGEQVFRQCLPCHAIGPGAKNKVGPELNGLDGRHSGTAPGYSYSAANKDSGITWNEAAFKDYIKDPRARIPGTKMIFSGIKDEKQADNLWAYIKQFDAEGNKK